MLFDLDDILRLQPHHTTGEVISCAEEIYQYISNHGNWQQPILPQEPGCSMMEFYPERFDFLSYEWVCQKQKEKRE